MLVQTLYCLLVLVGTAVASRSGQLRAAAAAARALTLQGEEYEAVDRDVWRAQPLVWERRSDRFRNEAVDAASTLKGRLLTQEQPADSSPLTPQTAAAPATHGHVHQPTEDSGIIAGQITTTKIPGVVIVAISAACFGFFILCLALAAYIWLKFFRKSQQHRAASSQSTKGVPENSKRSGSSSNGSGHRGTSLDPPKGSSSRKSWLGKKLITSADTSQVAPEATDPQGSLEDTKVATGGSSVLPTTSGAIALQAASPEKDSRNTQVATKASARVKSNERSAAVSHGSESHSSTVLLPQDQAPCDKKVVATGVPTGAKLCAPHQLQGDVIITSSSAATGFNTTTEDPNTTATFQNTTTEGAMESSQVVSGISLDGGVPPAVEGSSAFNSCISGQLTNTQGTSEAGETNEKLVPSTGNSCMSGAVLIAPPQSHPSHCNSFATEDSRLRTSVGHSSTMHATPNPQEDSFLNSRMGGTHTMHSSACIPIPLQALQPPFQPFQTLPQSLKPSKHSNATGAANQDPWTPTSAASSGYQGHTQSTKSTTSPRALACNLLNHHALGNRTAALANAATSSSFCSTAKSKGAGKSWASVFYNPRAAAPSSADTICSEASLQSTVPSVANSNPSGSTVVPGSVDAVLVGASQRRAAADQRYQHIYSALSTRTSISTNNEALPQAPSTLHYSPGVHCIPVSGDAATGVDADADRPANTTHAEPGEGDARRAAPLYPAHLAALSSSQGDRTWREEQASLHSTHRASSYPPFSNPPVTGADTENKDGPLTPPPAASRVPAQDGESLGSYQPQLSPLPVATSAAYAQMRHSVSQETNSVDTSTITSTTESKATQGDRTYVPPMSLAYASSGAASRSLPSSRKMWSSTLRPPKAPSSLATADSPKQMNIRHSLRPLLSSRQSSYQGTTGTMTTLEPGDSCSVRNGASGSMTDLGSHATSDLGTTETVGGGSLAHSVTAMLPDSMQSFDMADTTSTTASSALWPLPATKRRHQHAAAPPNPVIQTLHAVAHTTRTDSDGGHSHGAASDEDTTEDANSTYQSTTTGTGGIVNHLAAISLKSTASAASVMSALRLQCVREDGTLSSGLDTVMSLPSAAIEEDLIHEYLPEGSIESDLDEAEFETPRATSGDTASLTFVPPRAFNEPSAHEHEAFGVLTPDSGTPKGPKLKMLLEKDAREVQAGFDSGDPRDVQPAAQIGALDTSASSLAGDHTTSTSGLRTALYVVPENAEGFPKQGILPTTGSFHGCPTASCNVGAPAETGATNASETSSEFDCFLPPSPRGSSRTRTLNSNPGSALKLRNLLEKSRKTTVDSTGYWPDCDTNAFEVDDSGRQFSLTTATSSVKLPSPETPGSAPSEADTAGLCIPAAPSSNADTLPDVSTPPATDTVTEHACDAESDANLIRRSRESNSIVQDSADSTGYRADQQDSAVLPPITQHLAADDASDSYHDDAPAATESKKPSMRGTAEDITQREEIARDSTVDSTTSVAQPSSPFKPQEAGVGPAGFGTPPHSPQKQAPFNSPPKIISCMRLHPSISSEESMIAMSTHAPNASPAETTTTTTATATQVSAPHTQRAPSSPRLPISPTSESRRTSPQSSPEDFSMHATPCTSELVHATFSSDMQATDSLSPHEPEAANDMHGAHASPLSPKNLVAEPSETRLQLPGMEKVAELIREAEKDADKAWEASLGQLLDAMASSRIALLDSFILTGRERRRCKGNTVAQNAYSKVEGGGSATVVFYASQGLLMREQKLYDNAALAPLLPKCLHCCATGQTSGGSLAGYPQRSFLPPFVILEEGETLHEVLTRAKPTYLRALKILARIAERLEYLHAHGYVHRDLKPSNVLWLQHTARWTLAGLATAARTAEPAVPAFTLCYTPPEVAEELRRGESVFTPQPAQDAWGLGVIAIELLTGCPAFDLTKSDLSQVAAQLDGEQPLPWEAGNASAAAICESLRSLKGPVLTLLHRNPLLRPTVATFRDACTSALQALAAQK